MRRIPWLSAAILLLATAISLHTDLDGWAGDWNETGWDLGASGMTAATLAGLPLALYTRRNIEPLRSLELRCGGWRTACFLVRRCLAPSALTWLLVVATAYAITLALNPTPTRASIWPAVAATAAVLAILAISVALGLFLHPAFSLPLIILITYLVPATLDWADMDGTAPGFTPSGATHLSLPLIVVSTHFVFQTLFLTAVGVSAILLSEKQLRRKRLRAPAVVAVLLVGVSGTLVVSAPPATLAPTAAGEPLTNRYVCSETDNIRVCLLPDHERLLPETVETAEQVAQFLPPGSRPESYIEDTIDYPEIDDSAAYLEVGAVGIDPTEAVVTATADWNRCLDEENPFNHMYWLYYKLGMWPLDNLVEMDGMEFMSNASDNAQIAWWNEGLGSTC
ncbi:hypothetical protein [Actinomyces sp. 565]|uniref:hypothetical protein n=1 Tax=Actinomyces sp. 565 TaxID=2057794 RepID=UPI0013A68A89|nr:hypothetical protein [Actinomyces sp. 565]NDR52894.1 hypothetical protein [Actinomyces sp. 565]